MVLEPRARAPVARDDVGRGARREARVRLRAVALGLRALALLALLREAVELRGERSRRGEVHGREREEARRRVRAGAQEELPQPVGHLVRCGQQHVRRAAGHDAWRGWRGARAVGGDVLTEG